MCRVILPLCYEQVSDVYKNEKRCGQQLSTPCCVQLLCLFDQGLIILRIMNTNY